MVTNVTYRQATQNAPGSTSTKGAALTHAEIDGNFKSLVTAVDGKQENLVSGTNIKTVNSSSLLGSGNISVQGPLVSGTNIKTVNSTSLLGSGDVTVQPTLVSGTNIKTVNSTSLLGSGNISVGYSSVPQNSQSAAYTCVLGDSGYHILHPSADTTARTWTIPANSSVAYPIGTVITFVNQNGAGVITIAITTDTMRLAGSGTTGSRTLAANGMASALKITSTEWIISGSGLT